MQQQTMTRPRILPLEGAPNVRHLGGYATRYGRSTGAHIVRSSSLHRLGSDGLGVLTSWGIRTVVDLRSEGERNEFPTPDIAPLGIERIVAAVFEHDASPPALAPEFPGFAPIYQTFLETGRDAYRSVIETLATTSGGFLYHCAVGKDRTGVATALLLDLVGVADETIVEDYSQSGGLLAEMLPQWEEAMRGRGLDASRAAALMASPREDMVATIAHLRDRYGDAEGYFLEAGVSVGTIETARERLVDG
ncbi:MAG: tyrosine-protein phosphatase [Dehalococcoidia bacterium]